MPERVAESIADIMMRKAAADLWECDDVQRTMDVLVERFLASR